MNKLDDKVIVDRKTLVELDKFARKLGYDRHKLFARLNKALAADLTGWVAVPARPTEKMAFVGADCLPDSVCEWEACALEIYRAMLEASPPLPGGGE